jgi:AcrR family transcriptional regulator
VTSILEAADRILRTNGYEAASTNRVARVAGFSVGSLYQYFRDKQAIVGALIDRELAAEAEALVELLDANPKLCAAELAAAGFRLILERRAARAHLFRTLDNYAVELGATCVLRHLVRAQAPVASDALQRIAAQVLPRSARGLDVRTYVLARVATAAAYAAAVDAPPGVDAARLADAYAVAVAAYVDGIAAEPRATTLVLNWAKPLLTVAAHAELRVRRRREARAALVAAGVDAAQLEARAFLLASLGDAVASSAQPPQGLTQGELLKELAHFAQALGA